MATRPLPLRLHHHILSIDTKVSHLLHSLCHPYLPTSLLLLLELSADFRLFFPISVALFFSPLSHSLLPFLSPLLLGLLLDLALVGLVKVLLRRPRPPYNHSMSPAVSADNFSFPSGHASRVCFVAALVWLSVEGIEAALVELRASGRWIVGDEEKLAGILVVVVCVWAVMTAASRVLLGRHFFLDVLAGGCLGVLEGLFAFRFLQFEDFFSTFIYQTVGQGQS